MFRAIRSLLVAGSLLVALTASATLIFFEAPQYHPYPYIAPWPTLQGFEFTRSQWDWNGGRDTRNAPYMTGTVGAISSTFGTFTFNSIEIGGWPFDNLNIGGGVGGPTPITFFGFNGELLGIRFIELSYDNSFVKFSETIENVRTIGIGGASNSTPQARLGSITINEAPLNSNVPEPATIFMTILGMVLLGVSRKLAYLNIRTCAPTAKAK